LAWLQLLPNVKWLDIDLLELNYWVNDETISRNLHFFLERLEQLHVMCSSMNEEMMDKLLLYLIDSEHFSRLRGLRFIECSTISSAWNNFHQWIEIIFARSNKHQLIYLQFVFLDKEYLVKDLEVGNEFINVDPSFKFINLLDKDTSCSGSKEAKYD
jgi:hypothetical protein